MNNIIITVIVPAYNHQKYILECLDSIYKQTYHNFQWIVVDDGSIDNTPILLKNNQEKYGYQLILQKNKGLAQTLTDTISQYACGKYICICASDDYWCESKLEIQLHYMECHFDYAMCYGQTYEVDTDSNIICVGDSSKYKDGIVFNDIITQKFHPPVNYMIRKNILEEFDYYPQGIIAEDFYMNCLISSKYKVGYIPKILGYYRIEKLQKKRDPLILHESHKYTIDLFKDKPIYKKAIKLYYMRAFYSLSIFSSYKLISIKYAFRSILFAHKTLYLKGIYHFIFSWKDK